MRAAVIPIDGTEVANVIVCGADFEPEAGFELRELPADSPVAVGWLLDRANGTWAAPAPPSVRELEPIDFQRRFTPAAYLAAITLAESRTDPTMTYIWGLFDKAKTVHLDNPDTISGIAYMQHVAGILTAEEAAAVLA